MAGRNPHFSPGRRVDHVRQFIFNILLGPVLKACSYTRCWARPGLSFPLQRAHAPSHVVPATLFGREHALKEKILRHDHAPR